MLNNIQLFGILLGTIFVLGFSCSSENYTNTLSFNDESESQQVCFLYSRNVKIVAKIKVKQGVLQDSFIADFRATTAPRFPKTLLTFKKSYGGFGTHKSGEIRATYWDLTRELNFEFPASMSEEESFGFSHSAKCINLNLWRDRNVAERVEREAKFVCETESVDRYYKVEGRFLFGYVQSANIEISSLGEYENRILFRSKKIWKMDQNLSIKFNLHWFRNGGSFSLNQLIVNPDTNEEENLYLEGACLKDFVEAE